MKRPSGVSKENAKLGTMSLVTSIGDWLTYFALMKLAYETSGSLLVASLSMSMKSFAIAFGAWILPATAARFGTKMLMIIAQFTSGIILLGLGVILREGWNVSVAAIYVFSFLLMVLKQLFDTAREVHSKSLFDADTDNRGNQAELLRAIFLAQLLGPIFAFFLLSQFPVWVAVILDSASFLITTIVGLSLVSSFRGKDFDGGLTTTFNVFSYFVEKPKLRSIVLLRSVGFWIPNSFFNMMLFVVAVNVLGKGIESTAILYTVLGLGAAYTSHSLRDGWLGIPSFRVNDTKNGKLALISQLGFAFSSLVLGFIDTTIGLLLLVLVTGLSMGVNAVATQSIRRILTTPKELPNVISFEIVLGQLTGALSILVFGLLVSKFEVSNTSMMISACVLFSLSAIQHRKFD
jgi:MFS family permease